MDTWGTYERTSTNRDGEETTDTVTLQADPINRQRYEQKGFTFKSYVSPPGVGPAIQACAPGASTAEQIFGFLPDEDKANLDDNEIVKQAAEVALRKMTGTWTEAEAHEEVEAHAEGRIMPEETEFAIVQGNILAGYEALAGDGTGSAAVLSPVATTPPGGDGTGATAPAPEPVPTEPTNPPTSP